MKNLLKRYDIFFTFLIFMLMIPAEQNEWFSSFEDQFVSIRHILRTSYADPELVRFPQEKIAIVVQDDAFFKEYGSFPLRRDDIGKMAENIAFLGAKVVMVDILFDFASSYGEDPKIAERLKKAGNTIVVSILRFANGDPKKFEKVIFPVETIHKATETAYSNHQKLGNMLNRLRIYPEIGHVYGEWPISVKTAANYLGVKPIVKDGTLYLGDIKIKLDQFNDFRIDYPYLKPGVSFVSKDPFVGLSAMDILELDLEDEDEIDEFKSLISGKIVFIGDTSEISQDYFNTAVGKVYGVEALASEVATLLKGAPLRSATTFAEIIVALIFMLLLVTSNFLSDPRPRALASIGLFVGYFAFCAISYIYLDIVFSMTYVFLAGFLGFGAINIYLFIEERKQKSFITDAFGQYLSPDVIEALVEHPEKLSLGGERREMTAFFSDIQGFSTISESLTPDELVALLNKYLTAMCDIISEHNGTIDKFEGDAIIAFWGAPLDQPDHAKLACFACIDMQKALQNLREEWMKEGLPMVLVRMGVNSGPMVVGNMGSQSRMDYTIMGDSVNLAARLEGANKFYKNFSMISEFTYKQVADAVDVRELDTIRVVGKNEPITVYDLIDRKNQTSGKMAELVPIYNKGLQLYKDLDFKGAIPVFESALKLIPQDGPSITYIDRCKEFLKNPPPPDWDGVFTHTQKG
ncbi:MAG: adenylate/guanylate cyclase domain-containing protein [SAR324 cluster bacterium]|nr:adenylate/guanylate cyclase domain-containing protein [SAR324 cluster bacterium]